MSRRLKRCLVVVAGLGLLAGLPTVAIAAWTTAGNAATSATSTTLNRPAAPAVTRGAGTVGLTWATTTTASGVAASRYDVLRHNGSTVSTVCSGVTTTSCTDASPVATAVSYGVVARLGSAWVSVESPLTSFTYDTVAPVSTLSASPLANAAGWQNANVTVTISATDTGSPASGVREIHYTVNGGTEVVATGASTSFAVTQEQVNTIVYWAVDNVGNAETPKKQAQVKLDKTAPTTTSSPVSSTTVWRTSNAVTLTASDGLSGVATTFYKVDGAASFSAYPGAAITLAEGTHTISYYSVDVAGNTEATVTGTYKVDTTAPTTTINPTSSTTLWRSSNSVTLTATDGGTDTSGVASIAYKIDAGSFMSYSAPFTLTQGSHTVTYRATDAAGNAETDKTATIQVDTTAPTASVNPISGSRTTSVTITGADTGGSGVASVEYSLDGAGYASVSGTSTTVTFNTGQHTLQYRAVDSAGNVGTPVTATYNPDTQNPTVTITAPTAGTYKNNGNAGNSWQNVCSNIDASYKGRVCATATDDVSVSSVTYSLRITSGTNSGKCWDGSTYVTGSTCSVSMTLANGTWSGSNIPQGSMLVGGYTLVVTATDPSGKTGTQTVTFTMT